MPVTLIRLLTPTDAHAPDTDLLARFAADRDEAAFAELVRRHGPLVSRVCRRLAPAVAEDAFQAVFLALACRARSIREPAALAGWLVGVAGRIARQMRAAEQRRFERERAAGRDAAGGHEQTDVTDLAAALDDELSRLPEGLRAPVVMCLIEGRTHDQAAAALGGSARTLRRRLDRARAVLRARLERRGLVPAVAAGLIAGLGAPARAVSRDLVRATAAEVFRYLDGGPVTPAVAAAKGVLNDMVGFKTSAPVAAAAAALLCLGVVWSKDEPPAPQPVTSPSANRPADGLPRADAPAADPTLIPPPNGRPVAVPDRGNKYATANFVVSAPTPTMARALAAEAEYQRRVLALKWLGRELPAWSKPCPIRFDAQRTGTGGATAFAFDTNKAGEPALASAEMELRGEFLPVLTNALPHEVMHTFLATYFGGPVPRWADEGIAVLNESAEEQYNHDVRVRELLKAGRGIRLRVLLRMTEFPRDLIVLYAQGHSLARFLGRGKHPIKVPVLKDVPTVAGLFENGGADGHRRLIAFVRLGADGNTTESWTKAAKDVYGYKSLDDLEEAWLAWLQKPESSLEPKTYPVGSLVVNPDEGDKIPPTPLPGPTPRPAPAARP
jgi:RNA polymerase sigma factor (sigma-70 family)